MPNITLFSSSYYYDKDVLVVIFLTIALISWYLNIVEQNVDHTLYDMWYFIMVILWFATSVLDVSYTVIRGGHHISMHEKSPILRYVNKYIIRYTQRYILRCQLFRDEHFSKYTISTLIILITLSIEFCIIYFIPYVIWPYVWNLALFGIIATICAMIHISGFIRTYRFIQTRNFGLKCR